MRTAVWMRLGAGGTRSHQSPAQQLMHVCTEHARDSLIMHSAASQSCTQTLLIVKAVCVGVCAHVHVCVYVSVCVCVCVCVSV